MAKVHRRSSPFSFFMLGSSGTFYNCKIALVQSTKGQ